MIAIKYIRLWWTRHVTGMTEGRDAFEIVTGWLVRNRPLRRSDIDGKKILKCTLLQCKEFDSFGSGTLIYVAL